MTEYKYNNGMYSRIYKIEQLKKCFVTLKKIIFCTFLGAPHAASVLVGLSIRNGYEMVMCAYLLCSEYT